MQQQPPATEFGIAEARRVLGEVFAPWVMDLNLSIERFDVAPSGDAADWQPGAMLRLCTCSTLRRAALREAAPDGAELNRAWSSSPPGLVPLDAKAIQLGLDAFEKALGKRRALMRTGGTLPIVPALADKGIPTVITGFGLPDSQVHSPNERLVADYVPLGVGPGTRALPRVRLL